MKLVLRLLGLALILVAVIYLVTPADQLPSFFPGHEVGLDRIRVKHGLLSAAVGVALAVAGWWMGRR